ncbi:YonK-like protein [Bacillus phage vB_BanS_Sophrita]|uniref:YonK-like protein n=1 Tax=Bacillus phage vB_BanS_Sophrita TaxID=2894790 RepID=A0AAE8YXU9_9CAUD|nr:YonK-like protein [Bacillus phage vB_BanS_Sophrita]UGO50817.1 YonK-like protein [Bacillus phage vB_BanS_Sophrita]
MAKRTNSFSVKGELNLEEGVVYEVKKESVETIDFMEILKEFNGKTVKISIVEDIEIVGIDAEEDEEEE